MSTLNRLQQLAGITSLMESTNASGSGEKYSDHTIVNFTVDEDRKSGTEVVDLTNNWEFIDNFLDGDRSVTSIANLQQTLSQAYVSMKGDLTDLSSVEVTRIHRDYQSFTQKVGGVVQAVSSQYEGSPIEITVSVWGAETDVNVGVYICVNL